MSNVYRCFWINLPFGGVALIIIILLLRVPDREETKLSTQAKLSQLDAVGTSALVPAVVSLLLALEWGGLTYAVRWLPLSPTRASLLCRLTCQSGMTDAS